MGKHLNTLSNDKTQNWPKMKNGSDVMIYRSMYIHIYVHDIIFCSKNKITDDQQIKIDSEPIYQACSTKFWCVFLDLNLN